MLNSPIKLFSHDCYLASQNIHIVVVLLPMWDGIYSLMFCVFHYTLRREWCDILVFDFNSGLISCYPLHYAIVYGNLTLHLLNEPWTSQSCCIKVFSGSKKKKIWLIWIYIYSVLPPLYYPFKRRNHFSWNVFRNRE